MAQKRTTLRGWKKPEDGKTSACRLISSFACVFGGSGWGCSKSLTIDCAEQLTALVFFHGKEISSAALAESVNADPTFVRKSLSKLFKAGLVVTTRGTNKPAHWNIVERTWAKPA